MSFREILQQQQRGLEFMGSVGVIGLHMVSGPLVGFGIGYGLDYWLDSGPWGKLIFLIIGIGAGFLNVYRDSRQLLARMAREDARRRAAVPEVRSETGPMAGPETWAEAGPEAASEPARIADVPQGPEADGQPEGIAPADKGERHA